MNQYIGSDYDHLKDELKKLELTMEKTPASIFWTTGTKRKYADLLEAMAYEILKMSDEIREEIK